MIVIPNISNPITKSVTKYKLMKPEMFSFNKELPFKQIQNLHFPSVAKNVVAIVNKVVLMGSSNHSRSTNGSC